MSQVNKIKRFLKAKNPEALEVLMLNNNIATNAYYNYDIVFANGVWFAWFEQDASELLKQRVKEIERISRPN